MIGVRLVEDKSQRLSFFIADLKVVFQPFCYRCFNAIRSVAQPNWINVTVFEFPQRGLRYVAGAVVNRVSVAVADLGRALLE